MLIFLSCIFASKGWAAPTEIILWHSLAGQLGEEFSSLAKAFNQSQSKYFVTLVYKGDYLECLTSLAAAIRAKQAPALVQIFEVGTETMLHPQGIIKPVDEIMRNENLKLPEMDFFPSIRRYYSDNNQLMAFPFNASIPVLFYNAEAFEKIGITSTSFPKTWDELEKAAEKLLSSGYSCAYTSANPAWILIESFSAIHGLPVINADQSRVLFNNTAVIAHLNRLLRWQKRHYFEYGGRFDDSTVLFTSGRCPLYSQSSGAYNSLAEMVPFQLGVAPMPLDTAVSTKRYDNIPGGAALWALEGQSKEVYQGISQFFSFLSLPNVQYSWHIHTGYLPLGVTGIYQSIAKQSQHPVLPIARSELSASSAVTHLVPRLHNQIRAVNDEALEAIFAGLKTPKASMANAKLKADHFLKRFKRNTGQE